MKSSKPITIQYTGWAITWEKLPQRVYLSGKYTVTDSGQSQNRQEGWYFVVDTEYGLCSIDGDDYEASETNRICGLPIENTV